MIFQKIRNKEQGRTKYKLFSITVMERIDTLFQKKIFLFGLPIYRKVKIDALENTFEYISDQTIRLENLMLRAEKAAAVSGQHTEVFKKYKGIFKNKTIVIVGSGPTLNKYKPINDAIHIGLNRAYKYEKIELDFLFSQDISGLKEDIKEMNAYRKGKCLKFYGYNIMRDLSIPEIDVIEADASRYYSGGLGAPFFIDITNAPLADYGSVAFAALAFALYTHPKRICLVGCDVTQNYFFPTEKKIKTDAETMMQGWHAFKTFADNVYPDIEIVSINPVGLRGLFHDEFTSE